MSNLDYHNAANLITEIMEDVWDKRNMILPQTTAEIVDPKVLFSYRVSVSDYVEDIDLNFYFHYVLSNNRWWFTCSHMDSYQFDHSELIFRETDENRDWDVRCESYRRYAFSDLVRPMIKKYIQSYADQLKNPSDAHIWNLFPMIKFQK